MVLGVERSDLGLLPTFFMRVLSSSLLMSSYLGVLCPPDLGVFLDPSLLGVPATNPTPHPIATPRRTHLSTCWPRPRPPSASRWTRCCTILWSARRSSSRCCILVATHPGTPWKLHHSVSPRPPRHPSVLTVSVAAPVVAAGVGARVRARMGAALHERRLRWVPVGGRPLAGRDCPRVQERPVHVGGGGRRQMLRRRLLPVARRLLGVGRLVGRHEWRLPARRVRSVDVVAGAVGPSRRVGVVRRLVGHGRQSLHHVGRQVLRHPLDGLGVHRCNARAHITPHFAATSSSYR